MVEPAFAVFADEAYLHQAKELAQVGSALHGVWQGCEEGFSKLTTPLAPGNSTTFCVAAPSGPRGVLTKGGDFRPIGKGHHIFSVSEWNSSGTISLKAAQVFDNLVIDDPGYTIHDKGTYGGVTHDAYNIRVRDLFSTWLKNQSPKLSPGMGGKEGQAQFP